MDMCCSAYDIIRMTNKSNGRGPHWEILGSQVSVMPLATVEFQSREGCRKCGNFEQAVGMYWKGALVLENICK